ncbi:MAG: tRNA (N(6)-L-threonylcarbamoyladenosine(37)-C(2))-methylthiotransferase MtaB, partial [Clostridia bacterium]|nr:tRNA (N(6)-L-threonylcarbamoyladenosine(37)-C(2))-methylthiotransferase MtaB [Clostridia bacterium]
MKNFDRTVGILTLGCKVNQYESEAIAEAFEREGISILSPDEKCDAYVINTCTVTAESDRKARQFIRRAISKNPSAYILVTGCLAQTAPQSIADISGVDFVCGNTDKLSVVAAAVELFAKGEKNNGAVISVSDIDNSGFEKMEIKKFDRTRAYIKIEDGCESRCT